MEEKNSALDAADMPAEDFPAADAVLIVSLSTFPGELRPCRYVYRKEGQAEESGTYYYQQEPFPLRLRDRLGKNGEILMLTTPESRKSREVLREGSSLSTSPMEYFMDAVRAVPGLENVRFHAVEVEQDAPAGAIKEVVEHLRAQKRGGTVPKIYLGTNGGLRSIQLILEALLSLLSAEGIPVEPENVWSMRALGGNEWELCNSAEEFRVFDFVSGIREFVNYGRIDSLEAFLRSNPALNDVSARQLLEHLAEISEGFQFCSLRTFARGLDRLARYFRESPDTANLYFAMFRDTIRDDFGVLLKPERKALDVLEWCCRKGFYQQAYTMAESELPREFIKMGLFSHDDASAAAVDLPGWEGDPSVQVFNACLSKFVGLLQKNPQLKNKQQLELRNVGLDRVTLTADFSCSLAASFKGLLLMHSGIKAARNGLVHGAEGEARSTGDYKAAMREYLRRLRTVCARLPAASDFPASGGDHAGGGRLLQPL